MRAETTKECHVFVVVVVVVVVCEPEVPSHDTESVRLQPTVEPYYPLKLLFGLQQVRKAISRSATTPRPEYSVPQTGGGEDKGPWIVILPKPTHVYQNWEGPRETRGFFSFQWVARVCFLVIGCFVVFCCILNQH